MPIAKDGRSGARNEMAEAYLKLLSDSLQFSLWEEPPVRVSERPHQSFVRNALLKAANAVLAPLGAETVWRTEISEHQRKNGMFWPSAAHTMIGEYRMNNVREALETVIRDNVPGDVIETGVWRGGTCILMRGILKAHGEDERKVVVADSFAGLPPPDKERYPADKGDTHHKYSELAISRAQVEENFRKYGLLDDQVVFVEGFFEDTLHRLENERFALIRLDGDMYSSTIQALDALYPKLSPGGFCIIDDFGLKGCEKAVLDYRAAHGIEDEMIEIDWTGMFWRKS
ncbi:MAG: TylF/MycF/NovP-related O-methyltransferase [Rhizobiaceae bacterium]